jgi:hypothetical protein
MNFLIFEVNQTKTTNEIFRLEAETLINSISSFFFFVAFEKVDSLENRINADTRKVYFDELQKMS